MKSAFSPVEISAPPWLAEAIISLCAPQTALEDAEAACIDKTVSPTFMEHSAWPAFREKLLAAWKTHDHFVLRGLPAAGDGASTIWAATCLGFRFHTYDRARIVRHFQMSPWTTALSHTLQEGHFHTDMSTDPNPPCVTIIQSRVPDPGAPAFGQLRVARLHDIVEKLRRDQSEAVLSFLLHEDIPLLNESTGREWRGRLVSQDMIRFHPESIRAAERRGSGVSGRYEGALAALKDAGTACSDPIDLPKGDILFVSNRRALHYRSACTVKFTRAPSEFVSRKIYVAHLLENPS